MRQLIKYFLVAGCLALGLQGAWAYSLIGPSGSYDGVPTGFGDAWEQEIIGFNPIPNYNGAPPYLGADSVATGPKNIGEGYRRNTPVIYYAFDGTEGTFAKYFGANGEQAVVQAFDILNTLTNVDSYSSNLTEFPLQAQSQNYQATTLQLRDLKSTTLALMMEQMGLADAIRYVWILHNRFLQPGATCPAGMDYLVTMRNYPVSPSSLNQLEYSDYVNGELYTYYIPIDLCDQDPAPPDADAIELPADPLTQTAPVASGNVVAEGALRNGYFYTGLTRDDVAGLRALYSSNNVNLESIVPGSTLVSGSSGVGYTNFNDEFYLTTSNLTALIVAARTNNPAALQALYPGNPPDYAPLVISGVTTNLFSGTYNYTFGNVYTNHAYSPTPVEIQVVTTNIGPQVWAPYGVIITNVTTNTTIVQSNIVSGDFFLIPTNTCGLDILGVVATNVVGFTNTLGSINLTNATSGTTNFITITTNFVVVSTNYTLLVAPCEFQGGNTTATPTNGYFEGVERIQFVRVPDDNVDPFTGNFITPVTNVYSEMVKPPGGSPTVETFQRVLTRPDILFNAADLLPGPSAQNNIVQVYSRNINFNMSNIPAGLAGPGTIEPSTTVTFNKVGPVLHNLSPTRLTEVTATLDNFIWGSFDGSTNAPIVYPNGTSIATLAAEAFIQISPPGPALTNGTVGSAYSVTISASGGHAPYTWALASGSAGLPPGLSLSSDGVISGTPTQSGTFINIVIEVTDANNLVVDTTYSLTINSN